MPIPPANEHTPILGKILAVLSEKETMSLREMLTDDPQKPLSISDLASHFKAVSSSNILPNMQERMMQKVGSCIVHSKIFWCAPKEQRNELRKSLPQMTWLQELWARFNNRRLFGPHANEIQKCIVETLHKNPPPTLSEFQSIISIKLQEQYKKEHKKYWKKEQQTLLEDLWKEANVEDACYKNLASKPKESNSINDFLNTNLPPDASYNEVIPHKTENFSPLWTQEHKKNWKIYVTLLRIIYNDSPSLPQHFLYLSPLPQGQTSFLPTCGPT